VARGAASNVVGQVVVIATGILLTPLILGHVGATQYGLWALANSLVGYGGLLDLGISSAIQKYVAEHRARDRIDEASRLVSTAVLLYALLGVVAAVTLGVLAAVVPDVFGVPQDDRDAAFWLTVVVALQVGISLPAATPSAILRGSQRFVETNVLVIAGTLLSAVLIVIVLEAGGGIVAVAAVGVAVVAVMQIPAVLLVRQAVPDLRIAFDGVTRGSIRGLFSFSASVFVVRVAGVVAQRTDALVIGAALAVRSVTPYVLAQRLSEVIQLFTSQIGQVLLPLASEFDARDEQQRLRGLYLVATRIVLTLAAGLAITLGVLGGSILSVWVGEEYAEYGYLTAILAAAAVVDTLNWPAASILTGMARHRPLAWIALASAVANVALSVALVDPYGLKGVAVGTLLPSAVASLLLVLPLSLRTLHVELTEFLRSVVVPVIPPAALLAAALLAAEAMLDTQSVAVLAATVVAGAVLYAATYLRFSAGPLEVALCGGVLAWTKGLTSRTAGGKEPPS
jgi:O-antigen/teichoic acid export membrane protein